MESSFVKLVSVLVSVLVPFCRGLPSTSDCEPSGSCGDSTWNLAFAQRNAIQYVNFSRSSSISFTFQNYKHRPACLTTNIGDNVVYWSDNDANGLPAIYRSPLNVKSKSSPEIFVDTGIYSPDGISFDWITGNIYFIDSKVRKIIVCPTIKPIRCAEVLQEEMDIPYRLVLDPNDGLMFWTVNEIDPSIKRAQMDGSLPVSVITTDTQLLKALSVDEKRIFWTDVKKETIESAKYDGSDRRVVVKAHSYGIGILGESLYWTDPHGAVLKNANKHNGENVTTIMPEFISWALPLDINDVNIMHVSRQPISRDNSCATKGCSHVCVLSGLNNAKCLCPVEFVDHRPGCLDMTAEPKIFVAQNTTLLYMQVDTIGSDIFQSVPLSSYIKSIDVFVFNPVSKKLIVYDGISKKIFSFDLHSPERPNILVDKNIFNIVSMDIDFVSHNLFWLDAATEEVVMFSIYKQARRVIYKNVKNGHQIISNMGTMYVAKTGRTGKQEIHLVYIQRPTSDELIKSFSSDLTPVQMAHDKITDMLMIASSNGSYLTIESEYTAYRKHIGFSLNLKGRPVDALTKLGNRVYWLDQSNKMKVLTPGDILDGKYLLETITINDDTIGNKTKKLIAVYPGTDFLDQFKKEFEYHLCSYKYNNCPHICVPNADTGGGCWCEIGYEHDDYADTRNAKCVRSNSTGSNFEYLNTILEASDYAQDIDGDENSGTGGLIWGYIVLSMVIILFGGIIGYMGWYWRKTRSIPLIIKPFIRDEE